MHLFKLVLSAAAWEKKLKILDTGDLFTISFFHTFHQYLRTTRYISAELENISLKKFFFFVEMENIVEMEEIIISSNRKKETEMEIIEENEVS